MKTPGPFGFDQKKKHTKWGSLHGATQIKGRDRNACPLPRRNGIKKGRRQVGWGRNAKQKQKHTGLKGSRASSKKLNLKKSQKKKKKTTQNGWRLSPSGGGKDSTHKGGEHAGWINKTISTQRRKVTGGRGIHEERGGGCHYPGD